MPSPGHITVRGQSPYTQKNGVFDVEFAITESQPSDDQITKKSFLPIWRANAQLHVKNGEFETTLGSSDNPLPDKISTFATVFSLTPPNPNFWPLSCISL